MISQRKKKKTVIAIIIGALVLSVGIGFAIYTLINNQNQVSLEDSGAESRTAFPTKPPQVPDENWGKWGYPYVVVEGGNSPNDQFVVQRETSQNDIGYCTYSKLDGHFFESLPDPAYQDVYSYSTYNRTLRMMSGHYIEGEEGEEQSLKFCTVYRNISDQEYGQNNGFRGGEPHVDLNTYPGVTIPIPHIGTSYCPDMSSFQCIGDGGPEQEGTPAPDPRGCSGVPLAGYPETFSAGGPLVPDQPHDPTDFNTAPAYQLAPGEEVTKCWDLGPVGQCGVIETRYVFQDYQGSFEDELNGRPIDYAVMGYQYSLGENACTPKDCQIEADYACNGDTVQVQWLAQNEGANGSIDVGPSDSQDRIVVELDNTNDPWFTGGEEFEGGDTLFDTNNENFLSLSLNPYDTYQEFAIKDGIEYNARLAVYKNAMNDSTNKICQTDVSFTCNGQTDDNVEDGGSSGGGGGGVIIDEGEVTYEWGEWEESTEFSDIGSGDIQAFTIASDPSKEDHINQQLIRGNELNYRQYLNNQPQGDWQSQPIGDLDFPGGSAEIDAFDIYYNDNSGVVNTFTEQTLVQDQVAYRRSNEAGSWSDWSEISDFDGVGNGNIQAYNKFDNIRNNNTVTEVLIVDNSFYARFNGGAWTDLDITDVLPGSGDMEAFGNYISPTTGLISQYFFRGGELYFRELEQTTGGGGGIIINDDDGIGVNDGGSTGGNTGGGSGSSDDDTDGDTNSGGSTGGSDDGAGSGNDTDDSTNDGTDTGGSTGGSTSGGTSSGGNTGGGTTGGSTGGSTGGGTQQPTTTNNNGSPLPSTADGDTMKVFLVSGILLTLAGLFYIPWFASDEDRAYTSSQTVIKRD